MIDPVQPPLPDVRLVYPPDRKVKTLLAITALLVVFVIATLAAIAFGAVANKDSQTKANRAQIEDGNDQIATLQAQIAVLQTQAQASAIKILDQKTCLNRYDDAIQASSSEIFAIVGDLTVAISIIAPGDVRVKAVEMITGTATIHGTYDIAKDNLRKNVNARIQYNNAGEPLPCPLAPPNQNTNPYPVNPVAPSTVPVTIPITAPATTVPESTVPPTTADPQPTPTTIVDDSTTTIP